MKKIYLLGCMLILVLAAHAQKDMPINETIELSGPRFGFTVFGPGDQIDDLKDNDIEPFITQFG